MHPQTRGSSFRIASHIADGEVGRRPGAELPKSPGAVREVPDEIEGELPCGLGCLKMSRRQRGSTLQQRQPELIQRLARWIGALNLRQR